MKKLLFISILFVASCNKDDAPPAPIPSLNGKWKFISTSIIAVGPTNSIGPISLGYQDNEYLLINSDTNWTFHQHGISMGIGYNDSTVVGVFTIDYGRDTTDRKRSFQKVNDTTFVMKPKLSDTFFIRKLTKNNLVIFSKNKLTTHFKFHTIDSYGTF